MYHHCLVAQLAWPVTHYVNWAGHKLTDICPALLLHYLGEIKGVPASQVKISTLKVLIICLFNVMCLYGCHNGYMCAHRGQKRTSDSLEMDTQIGVNWELNLLPLQKQLVLLTEPALQLPYLLLVGAPGLGMG